MLLSASGLGKDYGPICAVDALDFEIAGGEIFGLLGPNGAGKTTTISMLAGVMEPSRGSATIDGHDIRTQPFAARRKLGLVPQELALYEELSARENLRFFASLYDLSRHEVGKAVDWALRIAGLSDRANQKVSSFSGGMKRRLNLVVGLVHRPKLLILDEPTVGVDPQSRKFLFDIITGLARDHGIAVLYTSHYMEEVQTLCERVAIVDHGTLVALDSVAALLSEHAEPRVTIDVRVADESRFRQCLQGIEGASYQDKRLTVPPQDSVAELMSTLEGASAKIIGLSSDAPDLENVFLRLTGHSLRDAE